jgi:hypothetical protein
VSSLRSTLETSVARLPLSLVLLALGGLAAPTAWANPVVCTTSLEAPAPLSPSTDTAPAPVEVTHCGPVERTDQLVVNRFYTWTAPYARGVDLLHQVTDLLGIAVAGPEGNRVMGLGFPDQTIVWDGSALQNTYQVLLEEQSSPIPWRTVDLSSGFSGSLAGDQPVQRLAPEPSSVPPVRGLW